MSEHSIKFNIGSNFNGDGFQKALNSIKTLNNNVKQAAGITSQMASALSMMDNSAAKCATAISGLLNAFASGNPILIGILVTMLAVTSAIDIFKKSEEEAKLKALELKEAHDKLHKSMQKLAAENIADMVKQITYEAKKLGDEFDRITKNANNFSKVISSINKEKNNGRVLQLELEKAQDMNNVSLNDKGVKEAEWNLKIQTEKNIIAQEERAKAELEATEAIKLNEEKRANLTEKSLNLLNEANKLRTELNYLDSNETEKKKAIEESITKLEEERTLVIKEALQLQADLNVLKQKELETLERNKNSELQSKIDLQQKENELADAVKDRQNKLEEAAKKEEEAIKKVAEEEEKKALKVKESTEKISEEEKKIQKANEELIKERNKLSLNYSKDNADINNGGSNGSYVDSNGNLHMSTRRNDNDWDNANSILKNNINDIIKSGGSIKGKEGAEAMKAYGKQMYDAAKAQGLSEYQARTALKNAERDWRNNASSSRVNDLIKDKQAKDNKNISDLKKENSKKNNATPSNKLNGGSGSGADGLDINSGMAVYDASANNKLDNIITKLDSLGLK